MTKAGQIHLLNTILIGFSCLFAFIFPFELFLFSYGILGPLHYLTEISWLRKRNFFTKTQTELLPFVVICVVVAILIMLKWNGFEQSNNNLVAHLIFLCVTLSFVYVLVERWIYRIILILLSIAIVTFLGNVPGYYTLFAVLLPTIIHVYLFTWAFMFYGALKERSVWGYISVFTLLLCSVVLIAFQPQNLFYDVNNLIQVIYKPFLNLNSMLARFLHLGPIKDQAELFKANAGFVVMRFVAFAYTYHYLNWFSKTTIIKWHVISKKEFLLIATLWIISVSLYLWDYLVGLRVLIFLSFLHVLLELPLNALTFSEIVKKLYPGRRV